jgi:hypothetical protein
MKFVLSFVFSSLVLTQLSAQFCAHFGGTVVIERCLNVVFKRIFN